jgi:hypothetical protein
MCPRVVNVLVVSIWMCLVRRKRQPVSPPEKAYARLGTVYGNLGQLGTAEEYRKKAFELKDCTSERERPYIAAHYYHDSGQLENSW